MLKAASALQSPCLSHNLAPWKAHRPSRTKLNPRVRPGSGPRFGQAREINKYLRQCLLSLTLRPGDHLFSSSFSDTSHSLPDKRVAMPSLPKTSSLLLLSSLGITLSAAEPIKLDFKKSLVNAPTFEKRAGGSEVAALNQDQYKAMYTLVSSSQIILRQV